MNKLGPWLICGLLVSIAFLGVRFIPDGSCDCIKTTIHPDDPQNFYQLRHNRISGLNIAGKFKGMLEYIPESYEPGSSDTYPLIIFFHGNGAAGNGSPTALCRMLYDGTNFVGSTLPGIIEKGLLPNVQHDGKTYEFMVLSPQLEVYSFPRNFPDANDVDTLISYILDRYPQVDRRRIYLTGISSGANIVVEYISSSVERASRIAAASIGSLCSYVDTERNRTVGLLPSNIGKANLPVWFIQGENDDKGCPPAIPEEWIRGIRAAGGTKTRLTLLHSNPQKDPGLRETRLTHNTWFRLYDPELVETPNQYDWFIQHSR